MTTLTSDLAWPASALGIWTQGKTMTSAASSNPSKRCGSRGRCSPRREMVINFRAEIWRSHVCRAEHHHSPQTYSLVCSLDTGEKKLNAARPAEPSYMNHPRTTHGPKRFDEALIVALAEKNLLPV